MVAVYYFDEECGFCPVKKYLEQYAIRDKDKEKQKKKKLNLLSILDRKIKHVLENKGIPMPPISYPLDKKFDYFEIKHRKNEKILIRIFYIKHNDKIVLLNALEKPDNYDTEKERRKIDKQLSVTQGFRNRFIKNPQLYEEYN